MTVIKLIPQKVRPQGYKITVDKGVLKKLPKILKKKFSYSRYVIITDTTVKRLYGNELKKGLTQAGLNVELLSFPNGEKSKNLKTVEKLINKMLSEEYDRSTCVIALGGGVVGDIAGFVASAYMRGIDFIQIPTTLLAMADASVGGKTGVNTRFGKNLIGAFHQPVAVFADIDTLQTLPDNELKNGYAEVIKQACIRDKKLFAYLEKHNLKILAKDPKKLKKIVTHSVQIKADVVSRDTKENGIRMILNYGHTYGHAIEKALKYTLHHGYAVAIGMCIINKMAVKEKVMKAKDAARIEGLLAAAGLPTKLPKKLTKAKLNKLLKTDKKRRGNKQNLIVVPRIGTAAIVEM